MEDSPDSACQGSNEQDYPWLNIDDNNCGDKRSVIKGMAFLTIVDHKPEIDEFAPSPLGPNKTVRKLISHAIFIGSFFQISLPCPYSDDCNYGDRAFIPPSFDVLLDHNQRFVGNTVSNFSPKRRVMQRTMRSKTSLPRTMK
jgi:hypothetical protein